MSASVVGSGELISTTTLGAKAGFVTFWVIIVSCFVKVAIQLEFGKQAIRTGESVMTSLNRLGGPRFGKKKSQLELVDLADSLVVQTTATGRYYWWSCHNIIYGFPLGEYNLVRRYCRNCCSIDGF